MIAYVKAENLKQRRTFLKKALVVGSINVSLTCICFDASLFYGKCL